MNRTLMMGLILGVLATGSLHAQTAGGANPSTTGSAMPALGATSQAMPRTDSPAPASVSSAANPRTTAAPVSGANSYTLGEARSRITDKGFSNVSDLKKDDKGVWRAAAMKDGKPVSVALDYQGNVVSQ